MRNFKCLFSTLALLVFKVSLLFATAAPHSVHGKDYSKINIATIDIAFFGYEESFKNKGLYYDLTNELALQAGLNPDNTIVPLPRAMQMLKQGTADITIMLSNAELEKSAAQLFPVTGLENIIVGLAGTKIDSLSDLHNKVVAGIRGAKYEETYDSDTAIIKWRTVSYEQSLDMLMNGRVDAIAGVKSSILWALKNSQYSQQSLGVPLVLNCRNSYLHLSNKALQPDLKPMLIQAFEQIKQQGKLKKIISKYYDLVGNGVCK